MTLTDDIAQRIYQSLLDATGDAVHLGDFDRYLPFFHLPHDVETFEGRVRIETAQELHRAFNRVRQGMQQLQVTKMLRTCTVAQFSDPHTIRGYHDTQLIDANQTQRETYSGLGTLSLIDGQWLISESQFVEEKESLPSQTVRSFSQGQPPIAAAF